MDEFATALLTALGLVFVIEGLAYALFPEGAQRLAALAQSIPPSSLRRGGLIAAVTGAGLVWLVRG
jgi:hypothetical protein